MNTYKEWKEKSFDIKEELFWIMYGKLTFPSLLLEIAVACRPLAVVKHLINERKAKVNLTDLTYCAAIGGNLEIVKHLINKKKFDVNTQGSIGNTLLHWAAISNSLEVVKYLIDKKKV